MIASPAIIAIILAIFVALAFSGGFAVSHWRDSGKIAKLESNNSVLKAANDKCAKDVQDVREALKDVSEAADAQRIAAEEAIKAAQSVVGVRMSKIMEIKSLPAVAPDRQCEAIANEQLAYVKSRLH